MYGTRGKRIEHMVELYGKSNWKGENEKKGENVAI